MLWKYINNCIGKHADKIKSCVTEKQRETVMKYTGIYIYKWKEKRIAEVSTWSTLAHIVWSPFGYIANSVILTGMRLAKTVIRDLNNRQRGYFTEASGESPSTVAAIVSQPIHTPTTVQAGVRLTVVQVQRTVLSWVARRTLAAEIFKEIMPIIKLIIVPFQFCRYLFHKIIRKEF